jgi:hypothetical protein
MPPRQNYIFSMGTLSREISKILAALIISVRAEAVLHKMTIRTAPVLEFQYP